MGSDKVYGGDGPDRLTGDEQGDEVNGNGGDDFIDVGDIATARNGDYGYGGLGDDTLHASGHDDDEGGPSHLFGNKGKDRLVGEGIVHGLFGGPGNDTLRGGRATYTEATQGVQVDLEAERAVGDGRDKLVDIAGVFGSGFDDTIEGSARDDFLYGDKGDDDLDGRAGDDLLDGGTGVDTCVDGETETDCES